MIEKHWKNYKWQKNNVYYNIHLQHNLLGRWSVMSIWGKNNDKSGNSKIKLFDTLDGALHHVSYLNKQRLKGKYNFIN